MEVYKAGDKWVLGLSGGHFKDLHKDAEAVIVNKHPPSPIRMWQAKTVVDVQEEKGEHWEYDYTFKEHQGDNANIFFLENQVYKVFTWILLRHNRIFCY
jgi:hypothetical protein